MSAPGYRVVIFRYRLPALVRCDISFIRAQFDSPNSLFKMHRYSVLITSLFPFHSVRSLTQNIN